MKIQLSIDYAIRILQYLHTRPGGLSTGATIAQSIGIEYPIFLKIATLLKEKRLLCSEKGRNGGYYPVLRSNQISIYDVFLAIEGELQISRCLQPDQDYEQSPLNACQLHEFYYGMQAWMIDAMKGQKIADLIR